MVWGGITLIYSTIQVLGGKFKSSIHVTKAKAKGMEKKIISILDLDLDLDLDLELNWMVIVIVSHRVFYLICSYTYI